MRLKNFSVGRVQAVQIGTEIVKTAHLKEPVNEPWVITADGAQGDQRAVHPDKIYAFARAAYEYWGRQLGVDSARWPDGFFGENLTLDVLDETDVRVGDVFTLGREVKLVVSGARTPCIKLTWRLNQPRSFQRMFARSRHAGAYFDVLVPGTVRPGDTLTRIEHDPDMPSVADVCDFIDSHDPPPLEVLDRLLNCRHLSPANQLLLRAKREAAQRAADRAENRWHGWRDFVILDVKHETKHIKSFFLAPSDQGPLCVSRPGQFVSVRLNTEDGPQIARTWSLSSFAHDPTIYKISVLRQKGAGSRRLHQCQPGDTVSLRAPTGNFTLDMGSIHPLVLVAAGIGITPLMAMLEAQLTKEQPGCIHLIYGAKSRANMAFCDALEALRKQHRELRVTYAFSQVPEKACHHGHIDLPLVKASLADLHVSLGGKRVELPWFEANFYICGPGEFCREMREAFIRGGADPNHVFTEQFTTKALEAPSLAESHVRFVTSKKEAYWKASDDLSLLELAEEAGVRLPSNCRAGACLTCKTRLLAGQTTADMGDGAALLCIGRPKTREIVLDA